MTRHGPRAVVPIALSMLIMVTGCGSSTAPPNEPTTAASPTPAASPTADSVAGTWSGTWKRSSQPPGGGSLKLVLAQQGQAVTGTIDVGTAICLSKGNLTGTLTGSALTFHADTPAAQGGGQTSADFQGTVSGDKVSGTLTSTCAAGTGVGTWEATRTT